MQVYYEFQRSQNFVGAFDGSKNSYFPRRPFQNNSRSFSFSCVLDQGEKPRECKVTLKKASTFTVDGRRMEDMLKDASESMPMIQALDVILRHLPSLQLQPVGRSFFSQPRDPFHLGAGREVWSGYYQSVRPAMGWKLMLNVDTAATAFYTQQSVFDFMCINLRRIHPGDAAKPLSKFDRDEFKNRELNDFERKQFSREIKGLRIVVTHLSYPRKYRVVDLTRLSARAQTFPLEDGSMCSVEDYFKRTYPNSHITHPKLPCLQVGQKSRHTYLPIDVCDLVKGQRCVKKLSEAQTANMIRHTAKPAWQRERTINDTVRGAHFDKDDIARGFGINVDNRMVQLESRVLDPPTLHYSSGERVTPQQGKGAWDMRNGTKFREGCTVSNWVVVVCSSQCNRGTCMDFINKLVKMSDEMGMTMSPNPYIEWLRPKQSVESGFQRVIKSSNNLDLIVAIIDKFHYNEVKRLGDSVDGMAVATQCVLSKTVEKKCNPATLGNICLKINARLDGKNSIIDLSSRPQVIQGMPVIIFGADVTHPRSEDTTSPSIASVVASVDLEGSKYRALHRNQKHRQEIIADLREMTKDHLIQFRGCTRQKPAKIIFYRDGVSEGQFDAVRQEEVAALQGACLDLQPNGSYQPKITFIVVQKRHHTRFFPVKKEKEDPLIGRGGNVPPGTTVDTVITHPTQHDFYLCSHAAIQGTSRPCHYHILWDDSDFNADEIQLLSYQLCHVFWRCNRSVSYPAPTYYAHRDAAHARMLLQAREDISK